MAKKKKLPEDTNKKAKSVVDMATGNDKAEKEDQLTKAQISELMSKLGKMGGKKGGPARKDALSPKRRKEIAQKAAAARWGHGK